VVSIAIVLLIGTFFLSPKSDKVDSCDWLVDLDILIRHH